jgi:hypothetical protein
MTVVDGNLPWEASGFFGAGIWVQGTLELTLDRVLVRDNRTAGLVALEAETKVTDSLFEETGVGKTPAWEGLGDGLVAVQSTVALDRVMARANWRAGFVFDGAEGMCSRLVSAENYYGIVVQDSESPRKPRAPEGAEGALLIGNDLDSPDLVLEVPDEPIDTSSLLETLDEL